MTEQAWTTQDPAPECSQAAVPPPGPSLRQRRERFLGPSLDVAMSLVGIAFLLSSLCRILGIGGGEATRAQSVLAGFALLLLGLAVGQTGSRMVSALRSEAPWPAWSSRRFQYYFLS